MMRKQQKSHVSLRETYLQGLAEATVLHRWTYLKEKGQEAHLQTLTEAQVTWLIQKERRRRMYKKIGLTLSVSLDNQGGILHIDILANLTNEAFPLGLDPKLWKVVLSTSTLKIFDSTTKLWIHPLAPVHWRQP
jgi:hypothetical protein